jgi:hypothetical protein
VWGRGSFCTSDPFHRMSLISGRRGMRRTHRALHPCRRASRHSLRLRNDPRPSFRRLRTPRRWLKRPLRLRALHRWLTCPLRLRRPPSAVLRRPPRAWHRHRDAHPLCPGHPPRCRRFPVLSTGGSKLRTAASFEVSGWFRGWFCSSRRSAERVRAYVHGPGLVVSAGTQFLFDAKGRIP